ncbi:MAG: hypothetical protein A3C62_00645 [Candidatus Zambryskibacteria bacterium RIFCSPHIGHO2_02_FULL_39_16]|uniref:Uncharacterized protein n=1 Tax=Candidatus Zambryskibacteria bacterium RIFCSPLOWO2_02_FULL_39_14 TaxID=1802769 RepID=A0A1G2UI02_9BACT|nr:MAG: hypothetical protein A3C62_00645 [Candidatus Zambryskibacteria bacterium RIFCSPHIGHO2_02_FULL_39_16]OHB09045.1 MAG: hypothetical protein A3I86_00120 [Candidatus Zambryskibacteria bacterium RIFCSPLOWO2_02_FULL_39_14]
MKSWKRITLVIFVLVGGTTSFGYWSIKQFDSVFDNLSATYLANTHSVYPSFKRNAGLASTSPEILGELATSTEGIILATTSTTTTATTTPVVTASANLELSFTFPQSNAQVYIGCTYPISWQSSATITSLETALIDAGTREAVGPKTGGLAKENTIKKDLANLEWKVGVVWPGAYYIKVSKINGVEAEFRSKTFQINKMPEGIDEEEKINICRESSG